MSDFINLSNLNNINEVIISEFKKLFQICLKFSE